MSDYTSVFGKHRERVTDMNATLEAIKGKKYATAVVQLVRSISLIEIISLRSQTPSPITIEIMQDVMSLGIAAAGVEYNDSPACKAFLADFEAQFNILIDAHREIKGRL